MSNAKLTYKRKKELFIILLVLLLLLSYNRVLKKTYIQLSNYISNTTTNINENSINKSLLNVTQRIQQLDYLLGEEDFNQNFIQQEILEFLSEKSEENKIEIILLEPVHFYKENDYLMVSNTFTLKGNYNALIKTIYEIEKEFKKSKLNSVNFYKKKNYSIRKEELFVKLLFQNFKKNKN